MKRDRARTFVWMRNILAVTILICATGNVWADSLSWTGAVDNDWFIAGNWDPAKVPEAGDTVLIPTGTPVLTNATPVLASFSIASGHTLIVEGWQSALRAETMTIEGIITHGINDVASTNEWGEWVPEHRILLEGSNITVAAGGRLDADWKGYRQGQGPGSPVWNPARGGAGHAGEGGFGGNNGGPPYGNPATPWQLGTGGGTHENRGGPGGGAIRIIADGELAIHGTIRANGHNGTTTHGNGGSGGSIWIECRTVTGSATGLVQANGGNGIHSGGGSGSGGRIAIAYTPAAQAALAVPRPNIRIEGVPGTQASQNAEPTRAAMGSLHLPDTLWIEADLTAKRFQWVQIHIPDWTVWEADTLILDDCIVGLPEGNGLDVTHNLILTNNAALHVFAAPVTDVLTESGAAVTVGGDFRVHNGCWITPHAHPTNGATVTFTVDGNLFVAADGGFDADRRGYTRGYGPGLEGTTSDNGAAGHGGISSMSSGGHRWGNAYGNAEWPIRAGSGGRSRTLAGRGGGAIRIEVTGRADLHGLLTANGGYGVATHGGGGSGGSILLVCETVSGRNSALLSADGGQGNHSSSACGGGGRIAVHYDPAKQAALCEPVPPIRFSTYAFPANTHVSFMINAREGTLWLPDTRFITETLDQQRFRHLRLIVPGFDSVWAPDSLTLDDCIITLPEGFVLDVANDLTLDNDAGLYVYAAPTNDPGQRYGAEIRVGRDLYIGTNSWIFPQANATNGAIVGIRVGRHATVDIGGGIDATGRGYMGVSGNTRGEGAGTEPYSGGGGYGGKGGGTGGGKAHGSAELPMEPGSPAAWNTWGGGYGLGGTGGGVIHLRAGGQVRMDGLLTADGWHGSYYRGSGGSGGAIFLAAHRFRGKGEMRAKGGIGSQDVASGGGGRVAIWHGIPSDMVESRLESRAIDGLLQHYPYARFTGEIDVGWYGDSTQGLPEEGSKWFYTIHGTVISVR